MDSPLKYFAELRDPRVERTREHLLEEILLITIAAILSGANGWNEIEDYADIISYEKLLERFLNEVRELRQEKEPI